MTGDQLRERITRIMFVGTLTTVILLVALAVTAQPAETTGPNITITNTRKVGNSTVYKLHVEQEGIPLTCLMAERYMNVAISCVES